MTAGGKSTQVTIRFDARLPHARWGPLFHVFRLEQPDVRLSWRPTGFPTRGHPLLEGADAALMLEPPRVPGLSGLTLDSSPMVVVVAAGHRLAGRHELAVADILDEPFPGGPDLDPQWAGFWTLDARRGRLARCTDDRINTADDGLEVIAAGRAIATIAASAAAGLAHPGVVALPLTDGPQVRTRLVWRSNDESPAVRSLVDLAVAWTRVDREDGAAQGSDWKRQAGR